MKLFSKSLKPEEVINFLKENPEFFIDHPCLLYTSDAADE